MNTPNPLLPQGTLPPPGRSSLYFKILIILAVHVVVLGAFLMSACKPTAQTSSIPKDLIADTGPSAPTTPDPYATPPTPVPLPPAGGGPTAPIVPQQQAQTPPIVSMGGPTPVPPVPTIQTTTTTARDATDYVITAGDTLDALHKKFNVSIKAIEDANPGVDPKKMQIGFKLHIPAATAVASASGPARATGDSAPAPAASGDTTTYVIKPGDVLMKIAKAHGTTVPAIEALNGMKTSAIQAGKTIKLPVIRVASADAAPGSPAAPVIPATPATPATPVRAN
jgi:LysM repeat protein